MVWARIIVSPAAPFPWWWLPPTWAPTIASTVGPILFSFFPTWWLPSTPSWIIIIVNITIVIVMIWVPGCMDCVRRWHQMCCRRSGFLLSFAFHPMASCWPWVDLCWDFFCGAVIIIIYCQNLVLRLRVGLKLSRWWVTRRLWLQDICCACIGEHRRWCSDWGEDGWNDPWFQGWSSAISLWRKHTRLHRCLMHRSRLHRSRLHRSMLQSGLHRTRLHRSRRHFTLHTSSRSNLRSHRRNLLRKRFLHVGLRRLAHCLWHSWWVCRGSLGSGLHHPLRLLDLLILRIPRKLIVALLVAGQWAAKARTLRHKG